jgi:hypothetical protein
MIAVDETTFPVVKTQAVAKINFDYFLIRYRDPKDGTVIALKARRIEDSSLGLSFIRVSQFFFETSSVVVQPTEVQMQDRFARVKSLHLSIYSIISVEEIGDTGARPQRRSNLKFKKTKSNLIAFPGDLPTPNR